MLLKTFPFSYLKKTMSDESFADLFQEKTVSRPTTKPGDQIEASVVGISGENIFLDVGAKSEGVIGAAELRNEAGELTVSIGDRIRVYLLPKRGGELACTTRVGGGQTTPREIEMAFQAGIPVEGKVTAEVKGGFSVTVAGHRCFCPYSQMDIRRVEQADTYLEKTMSFKIIEFANQGRNIILSARALQEEQRAQERERLKEELTEGMQVSGTVTSLRDFGAFVDLGGVDGLIPISEIAWGQTDKVEDVLSVGQQVQVMVKRLDWDRDRISLSLRETTENPWDNAADRYPAGSMHQGRVSRLAAFGAFITLEPGVDGLLHISRLGAGRRIHHPREVVEAGQDLTVRIESVDTVQHRIALVPEDYTPQEKMEDTSVPAGPREPVSMGTFGDLFKQQLARKKK